MTPASRTEGCQYRTSSTSITSGTTTSNGDYQRDYLLTMELLDIHTGESLKDSAMLRKGYHKSLLGKLKHYND